MTGAEIQERLAALRRRIASGDTCDLEDFQIARRIKRLRAELAKALKREKVAAPTPK